MNPEQTPESNLDSDPKPQSAFKQHFCQVTPLSKYLALALFISLPFIGGYVGYYYAPVGVVEVERVVVEEVEKEVVKETNHKEPVYGSFVKVNPEDYNIPSDFHKKYPYRFENQPVPDEVYAYQARRLDENLIILSIASRPGSHFPFTSVIYDETQEQFVRFANYPWMSVEYWPSTTTQIFIQEQWWVPGENSKVIIRDYVRNVEEVLYEEVEDNVQLSSVCEMGCVGMLEVTVGGEVVFTRNRVLEGTTETELIEEVKVSIPSDFLREDI